MKIAIDLRDYTCGIKRGIYYYVYGLYPALKKYDSQNLYLGIENYPLKNFRDKNPLSRTVWDNLILPSFVSQRQIDILHFTSPNETDFNIAKVGSIKRCKTIVTIHDIIPFLFPDKLLNPLSQNIRKTFEAQFQMALRADHLIAISQATKNDLIKTFNIKEDKISVVYQCNHDDRFRPRGKQEYEFLYQKYNLPKDFILNPSGQDFHKNFDNIVKAYSLLPSDLQDKHRLVIQGRYPEEELMRRKDLCQKLNISQNAIFVKPTDEDLPLFYNIATLTLATSLYEGFGLSPLESFSSGTAVIAGNTSSQPEVCGDAAILVDPYNPSKISQAIKKVLEDENLKQELINKGLEQAKKFSQEIRAKATVKVYEKVFGD